MDKKRTPEIRSFRRKVEARPTKIGLVVTKITELATEVYCREVIHRAKWKQRNNPARREGIISRRVRRRSSGNVRGKVNRRRIKVAKVSR
jgi:hypothetical protein